MSEKVEEGLRAALVEYERWDTGSSSRAGKTTEYHVVRMGDDGSYDVISVHKSRQECDARFERAAIRAAIAAYDSQARAEGWRAGADAMREMAAIAVALEDRAERDWIPESLWGKLTREAQARVRALPLEPGAGHE